MSSNLELWLQNPTTKLYIKVLKEHKTALLDRMLNCGVLNQEKLPELAQIKGQINALDLMLDIDQLESQLTEELENDGEEVHRD